MSKPVPVVALTRVLAEHAFLQAAGRYSEAKTELLLLENWRPKECLTFARRPDDIEPLDSEDTFEGHPCYEQGWNPGGPEECEGPRKWWEHEEVDRRAEYCGPCLEAVHTWERRQRLRRSIGGHVRSLLTAYKAWKELA